MAITFVAAGTLGVGAGSVNAGWPAGLQDGDILILHIAGDDAIAIADGQGSFGGSFINTVGSTGGGTTDCRSTCYWKRSDGTESGTVNIADAGVVTQARITAWRGCVALGNPINARNTSFGNTRNNPVNFPILVPTIEDTMYIAMHAAGDDNTITSYTKANLESLVEMYDDTTTISTDFEIAGAYGIMKAASTTGTPGATQLGIEQEANCAICLLPFVPYPAVISVEKFTLSMPDAAVSTPALSKGQVIANCVPFMTTTTDTGVGRATFIDIVANAGTDKFDLASAQSTGAREIELTIVEFDPAEVKVQEKSITLGSGGTANVTITAVDQAATFLLHYYKMDDSLGNFNAQLASCFLSSTTNVRTQKIAHSADLIGHVYVIEALNGAWEIETGDSIGFSIFSANLLKNTTVSVHANRTGLWSSWNISETSDDIRDAIWDGEINSEINFALTRGNGVTPSATGNLESYVVKFAPSIAAVQQGEFDYITATTKTAAITAPGVLGNAMVVGTAAQSWCEGSGTSSPRAAGQGRMSFNSATEVLGTRSGTGNGNYVQKFQVIEWFLKTNAPRIVSVGDLITGTGAVNAPYPAGLANNDMLILQIVGDDLTTTADPQGSFGGTLIGSVGSVLGGSSATCRVTAYWKRSDGTETGTVSIADAGGYTVVRISAWRGVKLGSSPIESDVGIRHDQIGNPEVEWDTITTTVKNVMVLCMHAAGDDDTFLFDHDPANLEIVAQLYDDESSAGLDAEIHMMYGPMAAAGATGAPLATQSGSGEREANLTIGLMPLVIAGPGGAEPFIIFIG